MLVDLKPWAGAPALQSKTVQDMKGCGRFVRLPISISASQRESLRGFVKSQFRDRNYLDRGRYTSLVTSTNAFGKVNQKVGARTFQAKFRFDF